ncbi:hypothetical protein CNMCM8694_002839 [Aspergillus lentulus]|nr:hypothetical protein CNMCM8060_003038 [Aspergillus lentulus]KAF4190850.1 hypothetical protein CNMCM8694_002839 [Aspergillus lentulus]
MHPRSQNLRLSLSRQTNTSSPHLEQVHSHSSEGWHNNGDLGTGPGRGTHHAHNQRGEQRGWRQRQQEQHHSRDEHGRHDRGRKVCKETRTGKTYRTSNVWLPDFDLS